MSFRLTKSARDDLIHIYVESVRMFGVAQAENYQDGLDRIFRILADSPHLARERTELTPPVRIHPSGSHVVVYQIEDTGGILIVRIRHALEDWAGSPI